MNCPSERECFICGLQGDAWDENHASCSHSFQEVTTDELLHNQARGIAQSLLKVEVAMPSSGSHAATFK